MAKRRHVETLGDMLAGVIKARRFTPWCIKHGLRPNTVSDIVDGKGTRTNRGTILALVDGLVAEKILPANAEPRVNEVRVRAACAAARAAKR